MSTKPNVLVRFQRGATGYEIGSVQAVSWFAGRANISDNFNANTCVIEGRNPENITTKPQIGDPILVRLYETSPTDAANFFGYVQDFSIQYGITSAYDTWSISVEGALGRAGRQTSTITTSSGASTLAMAQSINTAAPTVVSLSGTTGWGSTTSAQTYDRDLQTTIQALMATEQGWIVQGGDYDPPGSPDVLAYCILYGRNSSVGGATYTFSDVGANPYKYDSIVFRNLADNYSTKVLVSADGFATQSSGSGDYNYEISTINGSATEAANLATYVKTNFENNANVPYTIHTRGSMTDDSAYKLLSPNNVGRSVSIVFRGTTYTARIEGVQATADAEDWQVTLYLSSIAQSAWLILDSTLFGKLDTAKLGF